MAKMGEILKDTIKKIPFVLPLYRALRNYRNDVLARWREKKEIKRVTPEAEKFFSNAKDFVRALKVKENGNVELCSRDGLKITIRRNLWDARIVKEIFFDKPYLKHVSFPKNPIIVDIGGYIGDFTLYAAKYLDASKVIVYEPTNENFELLSKNINSNPLDAEIVAINKGVGSVPEIHLNVEITENQEIHASSYWYENAEDRIIKCDSLDDIMQIHNLDQVDLLKVDCEGGEFDIFPSTKKETYQKIRNIVFEIHVVENFESKRRDLLNFLEGVGYNIKTEKNIIYASK